MMKPHIVTTKREYNVPKEILHKLGIAGTLTDIRLSDDKSHIFITTEE